jgi:hypothetical protein
MSLVEVGRRLKEAFKHSTKHEDKDTFKQEENEKLQRMRKVKGSVKSR